MHRGCVSTGDSDAGIFYLGVNGGEAASVDISNKLRSSNPMTALSEDDVLTQHTPPHARLIDTSETVQHDSRPPKNAPSR